MSIGRNVQVLRITRTYNNNKNVSSLLFVIVDCEWQMVSYFLCAAEMCPQTLVLVICLDLGEKKL